MIEGINIKVAQSGYPAVAQTVEQSRLMKEGGLCGGILAARSGATYSSCPGAYAASAARVSPANFKLTIACRFRVAVKPYYGMVRQRAGIATLKREHPYMTTSAFPILRLWQNEAMDSVRIEWRVPDSNPLVAACPAAGKTLFGVHMGKLAIDDYDCGLVLNVSPTVNVKETWETNYNAIGLRATSKVRNDTLKDRLEYSESLIGDRNVICVTYSQLAREKSLFAEMLRRHGGLLTADEPHHADESAAYGIALNLAAEAAKRRLALTGTPFNTRGTPLSMIPSVEEVEPDGRRSRRAIPSYAYDYGRAIAEQVCRPVEFITVMGRGQVTYRSLLKKKVWDKVVDLAKANKTDRLSALLAPDGDFIIEMLETGIKALLNMQQTDRRAGMLIAVSDTIEGQRIWTVLQGIMATNPQWSHLTLATIFHDTPGAHERLDQLKSDHTDIVIAVRMISEGVDIPRLRIGVYATNYLTRLFFIQLVGRFVRWEGRLDPYQFSQVIIPAHILLIEWAREIEALVNKAMIPDEGEGGGEGADTEIIDRRSQATGKGAIHRGQQEDDIAPAAEFFRRVPAAVGRVPDLLATLIQRSYEEGTTPGQSNYPQGTGVNPTGDLRGRNKSLVRRIVRMMAQNGDADEGAYKFVNGKANKAVGIRRLDDLTTDEELARRAEFLRAWLISLSNGGADEEP